MRIQLIPDARVATLTQKSRKMAKMQKPVLAKPIGRQKPVLSVSEIGLQKPVLAKPIGRQKPVLSPTGKIGRIPQKTKKMHVVNFFC